MQINLSYQAASVDGEQIAANALQSMWGKIWPDIEDLRVKLGCASERLELLGREIEGSIGQCLLEHTEPHGMQWDGDTFERVIYLQIERTPSGDELQAMDVWSANGSPTDGSSHLEPLAVYEWPLLREAIKGSGEVTVVALFESVSAVPGDDGPKFKITSEAL